MAERTKLKKFSEFAASLLPHETSYLLSIEQFQDEDRLKILEIVHQVANDPSKADLLNSNIDKRKYSHLKNWIEEHLTEINVDFQFDWIASTLQQILKDSLTAEDERKILKIVKLLYILQVKIIIAFFRI